METKIKNQRGEMASSERSKNQSKELKFKELRGKLKLVCVKYRDHVLFRNCNPAELSPSVREVAGWLTFEGFEAICLCYDKPVVSLPNELQQSGFLILKNDIIAIHEIKAGKPFKLSLVPSYGLKPYKMENKEKCKS